MSTPTNPEHAPTPPADAPFLDDLLTRLKADEKRKTEALEAVLMFHSSGPWDETKRTEWWNRTQTIEATTRNLCDTVRLALGLLPSCFGDYTDKPPSVLPSDMPLSSEQRNALIALRVLKGEPPNV